MQSSNELLNKLESFARKHKLRVRLAALGCFVGLWIFCGLICVWYEMNHNETEKLQVPFEQNDMTKKLESLSVTSLDVLNEIEHCIDVNLSDYKEELAITKGGNYRLFGEINTNIRINVEEDNIHLFLDNVNVSSKKGPAIYCEKANKLLITLLPGTVNVISDFGDYREYEEYDACIYSESSVTFNGTGKLIVNGYYKDAIRSKDVLKFIDGTYEIKSKRNGVYGNDGILIRDGDYQISGEKDGFKTAKKGSQGKGCMVISGGDLSVIAGQYAFHAVKADIYVYDCTVLERSVVSTFKVGGNQYIQEGCMR